MCGQSSRQEHVISNQQCLANSQRIYVKRHRQQPTLFCATMRACQDSARSQQYSSKRTVVFIVGSLLRRTTSICFCLLVQRQCVHRPDDIRPKAPLSDKKKGPPYKPQKASSQRDEEKHQSENTAGVCVCLKATTYTHKYIDCDELLDTKWAVTESRHAQ